MPNRLSPIGFWSYARQDDDASLGRLSGLRKLLQAELQQQYGRQPIQIFQDVAVIAPGAQWKDEISRALANAAFLIPIITPAFLESEMCCEEVRLFLERERRLNADHPELTGRRRIFPIRYMEIEDIDPFDSDVLAELQTLQWIDFTRLRFKSDHEEPVRIAFAELARGVAKLLQARIESPPVQARVELPAAEEESQAALRELMKTADEVVQKATANAEKADAAAEEAMKAAENAKRGEPGHGRMAGATKHDDGTYEYFGQVSNYVPHGYGVRKFSSGEIHKGRFVNNKMDGYCVFTSIEGGTIRGQFHNNQPHGYCVDNNKTGSGYYNYMDGDRSGIGAFYHHDGKKFYGTFEQGVVKGLGVFFGESGAVIQAGFWEDNEMIRPVVFRP